MAMSMEHSDHTHGTDTPVADTASRHGMAVVGVDTIFLSHLAMFDPPHHHQVILQASFGSSDSTYRDDRKRNPSTRLYTFAPRKFVLPELFPGKAGEPPSRKSFVGSLVRNHFEQPPAHPEESEEIASEVVVEVINVIYHHELDRRAQRLEHLTYMLFGKGSERFLAHRISSPPDFDHLQLVDVQGRDFSDDQLRHGVEITVTGRLNEPSNKVQERETVAAIARVDGQEVPVEIDAKDELYFDTNDFT